MTLSTEVWLRLTYGEPEAKIKIGALARVGTPGPRSLCPRRYDPVLFPPAKLAILTTALTQPLDYSPDGSVTRCRELFAGRPDLRQRPFQIIQSVQEPTDASVSC